MMLHSLDLDADFYERSKRDSDVSWSSNIGSLSNSYRQSFLSGLSSQLLRESACTEEQAASMHACEASLLSASGRVSLTSLPDTSARRDYSSSFVNRDSLSWRSSSCITNTARESLNCGDVQAPPKKRFGVGEGTGKNDSTQPDLLRGRRSGCGVGVVLGDGDYLETSICESMSVLRTLPESAAEEAEDDDDEGGYGGERVLLGQSLMEGECDVTKKEREEHCQRAQEGTWNGSQEGIPRSRASAAHEDDDAVVDAVVDAERHRRQEGEESELLDVAMSEGGSPIRWRLSNENDSEEPRVGPYVCLSVCLHACVCVCACARAACA